MFDRLSLAENFQCYSFNGIKRMDLIYLALNLLKEDKVIDIVEYVKLFKKIKKWENTYGETTKAELKRTIIEIKKLKNILNKNRTYSRKEAQRDLAKYRKKASELQFSINNFKKTLTS